MGLPHSVNSFSAFQVRDLSLIGRLRPCDCQPGRAAAASASAQGNWPGFGPAGVDHYLLVKLASSGVWGVREPLLEAAIKMAGTRAGSADRSSQRRGAMAGRGAMDG